ncbi:hypothetical protein KC845_03900 [Candidatus Kaiserbacteria bacterium]|nr:hypothetical protein [Candidatus Kaiserbacteria bacterium]
MGRINARYDFFKVMAFLSKKLVTVLLGLTLLSGPLSLLAAETVVEETKVSDFCEAVFKQEHLKVEFLPLEQTVFKTKDEIVTKFSIQNLSSIALQNLNVYVAVMPAYEEPILMPFDFVTTDSGLKLEAGATKEYDFSWAISEMLPKGEYYLALYVTQQSSEVAYAQTFSDRVGLAGQSFSVESDFIPKTGFDFGSFTVDDHLVYPVRDESELDSIRVVPDGYRILVNTSPVEIKVIVKNSATTTAGSGQLTWELYDGLEPSPQSLLNTKKEAIKLVPLGQKEHSFMVQTPVDANRVNENPDLVDVVKEEQLYKDAYLVKLTLETDDGFNIETLLPLVKNKERVRSLPPQIKYVGLTGNQTEAFACVSYNPSDITGEDEMKSLEIKLSAQSNDDRVAEVTDLLLANSDDPNIKGRHTIVTKLPLVTDKISLSVSVRQGLLGDDAQNVAYNFLQNREVDKLDIQYMCEDGSCGQADPDYSNQDIKKALQIAQYILIVLVGLLGLWLLTIYRKNLNKNENSKIE